MYPHIHISILYFLSWKYTDKTGDKYICSHNQDYTPSLFFIEKKIEFQEKN